MSNIPEEMRRRPQWVGYMLLENKDKGKPDKVPIDPHTMRGAASNRPDTWGTFEQAQAIVGRRGRCKREGETASAPVCGVGWEFNGDGIVGIDFDHCLQEGQLDPWVARWVEQFHSYTEISPSGEGLHIFCKGKLPGKAVKRPEAELYDRGRYFTVTGDAYGPVRGLEPAQEAIDALYGEFKPEPPQRPVLPPVGKDYLAVGLERDAKLRSLWEGDRPNGNESSDDQALMNKLAYWCNCDQNAMIGAFLSSPHAAGKDDGHKRKAARKDYMERTAQRAIESCRRTAQEDDEIHRRQGVMRDFKVFIESDANNIKNPVNVEMLLGTPMNDRGAAELFAHIFGNVLRFMPEYKDWFIYEGGVWRHDVGSLLARQKAVLFSTYVLAAIPAAGGGDGPITDGDQYHALRKHYAKYGSLKNRETLLRDAQSFLPGYSKDFNIQPLLFNCQNGTFNLETMTLQPHEPMDKLSKQASVLYDPSARCERFEQFIDEITEGNKERAQYLQKALGYAMKGYANEECYFTALGEKTRNGKGTLFDTILNLFGSYGAQIDFNTIAHAGSRDGSRATPDLARLIGTRFVLANEPDKGVYLNEALLKQITGNDDITARPLFGAPIQFKPVFKLFITANSKPGVTDDSLFSSGRIKLLLFQKHFAEEQRDTGLKAKFRTADAKSGILNWLIEGYKLYCKEGLKNTEEMQRAIGEYQQESDYIGQFLLENFTADPHARLRVRDLLKSYQFWCSDMGIKPLGFKAFKEELKKHGIPPYGYGNVPVVNGKFSTQI